MTSAFDDVHCTCLPLLQGQGMRAHIQPCHVAAASLPPLTMLPESQPTTLFAPCPRCGDLHSERVTYTWWGGLVGPRLFTHVRCRRCGCMYNGRTGGSNRRAIRVYQRVTASLSMLIAVMAVLVVLAT